MNGIIFYSNTNQGKNIAEYFAKKTGWEQYDLNCPKQAQALATIQFERAVLIFPVYSQNIPIVVKTALKNLTSRYLTAIATHGKMCHGRVLYELQKHYDRGELIAAAYAPMKHSYLQEATEIPLTPLDGIIQKTLSEKPTPIAVGKTYKNPFANFAKDLRSRMCVKMHINPSICAHCGKCERDCLFSGIKSGKVTHRCIRCLKCVTNCPTGALSYQNRAILRLYLKKSPLTEWGIYL